MNDISEVSENGTHGSIRAKFTVAKGRSNPSTTAIQFISEGATLSGVEFELVGQGYRISLAKKRFGTGKKICTSAQLITLADNVTYSIYMSRTCDFQQCGILTNVDSDESVQPPFKLRNSK